MFVAMNQAQALVTLVDHQQAERLRHEAFVCPACRQPVRVKNGAVMPAHFAHVGPACDVDSEGESAVHLRGKRWLAALGAALGYAVVLEAYYPAIRQRADVVWQAAGRTVVIEFQCSPLSPRRLAERTRGYAKLGLDCVWVLGPRYHSPRLGAMQARFMCFDQAHGYHLWFADGVSFLALWQWQAGRWRVTRYTRGGVHAYWLPAAHSPQKEACLVQNALHHRDARVLRLQALAYQSGHHLAGVPWVVHAAPAGLPGLRLPEWQLRTRWLLAFEGQAHISREINVSNE